MSQEPSGLVGLGILPGSEDPIQNRLEKTQFG